jgi:predicted RNA-binding protein with PUA-like domain
MKKGDGVLVYYSSTKPNAVVGTCEIVKEGYPDKTQFDPDDEHFFPSADPDNPSWFSVDIKFVSQFKHPVTLDEIKAKPGLRNMRLIQRGNRLSVMPVSKEEFDEIVRMGKG